MAFIENTTYPAACTIAEYIFPNKQQKRNAVIDGAHPFRLPDPGGK